MSPSIDLYGAEVLDGVRVDGGYGTNLARDEESPGSPAPMKGLTTPTVFIYKPKSKAGFPSH